MELLDTSAWIEYFKGSEKGLFVKKLIEENEVYTSAITIAEISKWFYENNHDIKLGISQIKINSIIIELSEEILIESGKKYVDLRKINNKIGLIDVIIYVSSQIYNLDLITKDSDFKNLANVKII